jgi:hypothetical protein
MRVVSDQERLAPPALCFICETSPIREGERPNVVDTQRDFNPPALSHLSGRKYICERCVDEAAHLLGYVRTDELETAQNMMDQARASLGQDCLPSTESSRRSKHAYQRCGGSIP